MSLPARRLDEAVPPPRRPSGSRPRPSGRPTPSDRPAPSTRTTAARPRRPSPPQPRARARRGFHLAFWIFAAAVVSSIVVGIVAVNALVVNTTYRIESVQQNLDDLRTQQATLSTEVARLSSPSRIAEWATAQQLVMPDDVVILRVDGVGSRS